MHTLTISQLSEGLRKGEFSSTELTQHYLQRIEALDDEYNSFISVTPEQALEQALAADQRLKSGEYSPLLGVPIAHKDLFCTQGVKTSSASKMLDNFIAPYDATVVAKLKAAGMPMLGKTNMDEFAMGSTNETSFYGATANPFDVDRIPGGSSGGSAAAVAAMLAPVATASDTGGSIRQPASHCGLTGIKPTYGAISRFGMIAFASSLDQAGVVARNAEDASLILDAMMGHDTLDSTSNPRESDKSYASLTQSLKGKTIGLPSQLFDGSLNNHVMKAVEDAKAVFESLGATFVDIDLNAISKAVSAYYVIAPAEASANLARYDGVKFGYRCDHPQNLDDLYIRSRSEGFGDEVKRRIMIGTYALSAGYYDAYYKKAQQVRALISQQLIAAFTDVDLILGPTAPTSARMLGTLDVDPVELYLEDSFTIPANLAGLPAISFCGGFNSGLPIGIQLMANHYAEADLLNAAHQFQQVTDWHTQAEAMITEKQS